MGTRQDNTTQDHKVKVRVRVRVRVRVDGRGKWGRRGEEGGGGLKEKGKG